LIEYYNLNIKDIYGEIIDFSTKAQANMSPEDIEMMYRLKLANRAIIEAVKDTKNLQKNMMKYTNNPNIHIKERYDAIKKDLAELLRSINTIATTDEEDIIVIILSKIKIRMEKYDIIANGLLDDLIKNNLITNKMAASLMNDSAYAFDISKSFMKMAKIIFVDNNNEMKSIGADMLINEEDIDSILKKRISNGC